MQAGRDPHERPCSHREAQRETASTEKAMGETPVPWAFCDGVWGVSQEPPWPSGCSRHCQAAALWRKGRGRGLAVPQVHPPSTDPETGRAGPPSGLSRSCILICELPVSRPLFRVISLCGHPPHSPHPPAEGRLARPMGQACSLLVPWHRGRAAREPIRFGNHPSCVCDSSFWKSHSETLFVKKRAFRDQMSSLSSC